MAVLAVAKPPSDEGVNCSSPHGANCLLNRDPVVNRVLVKGDVLIYGQSIGYL